MLWVFVMIVCDILLFVVLVCFGFVVFGYEIVWMWLCMLMFGSEMFGVFVMFVGFFGGIDEFILLFVTGCG